MAMSPDHHLAYVMGLSAAEDTARVAVMSADKIDPEGKLPKEVRMAMQETFRAACGHVADAIGAAIKHMNERQH
jgi:hypothetical protein